MNNTYDLLEQGIYNADIFLERSRSLSERINQTNNDINTLSKDLDIEIQREESAVTIIPKVEKLLAVYHDLPDAKAKNDMLKEVLEKIVYIKEKKASRNGSLDDFQIILYPKIPTQFDK